MYDSQEYFASIVLDDNGRSCCVTCRELLHIDGAGRTIAHGHTIDPDDPDASRLSTDEA